MRLVQLASALVALLLLGAPTAAQHPQTSPAQTSPAQASPAKTWPTKPVRIVVPGSPGGAIDLTARLIAEKITAPLGQSVVVENKPGASNNLGTDLVAKSPPDGYNLVIVSVSHAANPSLFRKLSYDPVRDFEPVVLAHAVPLVLVAGSQVPARDVRELVAWLKEDKARANYASSGQGQVQHLSAELFRGMTGLDLLHVPYKGSTFAHPDLISGRASIMFDTITAVQPHLKSGALRAFAVTTATRAEALPDVPTLAEAGLPGYETSTWGGILAPAGTPAPVIDRLNAEMNRALRDPELRAKLAGAGMVPQGGTPQDFAAFMRAETEKWAKIVREAGITPE